MSLIRLNLSSIPSSIFSGTLSYPESLADSMAQISDCTPTFLVGFKAVRITQIKVNSSFFNMRQCQDSK
eukprot:4392304-Ditylum_brightwellii.AAC.1